MEFTFKKKENNGSLPFLERFKHKINRVDRITGLIGVLGVVPQPMKRSESLKRRLRTEGNVNKGSLKFLSNKNESEVLATSRFHSVEVNHFHPLGEDLREGKQNMDINAGSRANTVDKERDELNAVMKRRQEELGRNAQQLKRLILPRIGLDSSSVPQASRIRQKMQRKYDRFRLMNLGKKNQKMGVPLRQ